jgi:hypothetical protein
VKSPVAAVGQERRHIARRTFRAIIEEQKLVEDILEDKPARGAGKQRKKDAVIPKERICTTNSSSARSRSLMVFVQLRIAEGFKYSAELMAATHEP